MDGIFKIGSGYIYGTFCSKHLQAVNVATAFKISFATLWPKYHNASFIIHT